MSGKQPDKLLIEYCPDVLWDHIKPIFRFYFSKVVQFSPELMKMLPSQLKEKYGEGFKKSCVIEGMGSSSLGPILNDYKSLLFIREPVERVLTQYERLKKNDGENRDELKSISSYVHFLKKNGLDNMQSKTVCGHATDLQSHDDIESLPLDTLLQDVIKNLNRFDWILSSRDFNIALYKLYQDFNWKRKPYYLFDYRPHHNQMIRLLDGLTDSEFELIRETEKCDFELYVHLAEKRTPLIGDRAFQNEFDTFYSENSYRRLKTKFEYFLFDLRERFFGA